MKCDRCIGFVGEPCPETCSMLPAKKILDKIKFHEFECMAGEKDETGEPLLCDPPICGIDDCPVMLLREALASLASDRERKP